MHISIMINKFKIFINIALLALLFSTNSNANIFKIKDLEIELFEKNKLLKSKKIINDEIAKVDVNIFAEKYENKQIKSLITVVTCKTSRYSNMIKLFFDEYFFLNDYSFFKNNENKNFILIDQKKNNVISINEINLTKYLKISDDFPEYKREIKRIAKKNNVILPERVLRSDHIYLRGNGDLVWVSHMFNYKLDLNDEIYEKKKSNFHPDLINKDKEISNYMNNWINLSLSRHKEFQNNLKIKSKLDLKYAGFNPQITLIDYKERFYNSEGIKISLEKNQINEKAKKEKLKKDKLAAEKKAKEEKERKDKLAAEKKAKEEKLKKDKLDSSKPKDELSVDDLMSKIKELNEMFKSGLITKDEFEMLKNKLLKN